LPGLLSIKVETEKASDGRARKEGQLVFYGTNSWIADAVAKEFEKKYPFVKVTAWRSDSSKMLKRTMEEYSAGLYNVDSIETSHPPIRMLQSKGILQSSTPLKGLLRR